MGGEAGPGGGGLEGGRWKNLPGKTQISEVVHRWS